MVAKHIKNLLYEHDCVIIPGFGGLIARYAPAVIQPVKHTISPPSKRIAFNEKLILNDGLLISTIAYHNGITTAEAQQMVAAFVTNAKYQLKTENRFELSEVGIFKYNAAQRLEFEYRENDNLLEASFGLPEIVARPVKAEESAVLRTLQKARVQDQPVTGNKFKRRLRKVYSAAAGLAIAGLTGSALYLLSIQTDYNLSTLNPITQFSTANKAAVASPYSADYTHLTAEERAELYHTILPVFEQQAPETIVAADDELLFAETDTSAIAAEDAINQDVIVEEAAEPVLTISEKTGRFYIITGGYARLENAETGRSAVLENGHEGKVLTPLKGSRLYRVSVADFATTEEAQAAMNTYRKTYGDSIWILNN